MSQTSNPATAGSWRSGSASNRAPGAGSSWRSGASAAAAPSEGSRPRWSRDETKSDGAPVAFSSLQRRTNEPLRQREPEKINPRAAALEAIGGNSGGGGEVSYGSAVRRDCIA